MKILFALVLFASTSFAEWKVSDGFAIETESKDLKENIDVYVSSRADDIKENAKKLTLLGYTPAEIAEKQAEGVEGGTLIILNPNQFKYLVVMKADGTVVSRVERGRERGLSWLSYQLPEFEGRMHFRLVDLNGGNKLEFDLVKTGR